MSETILKATKIKKSFPSPTPTEILKGIDLEVRRGETIAIMGKSGEGKSTLLHILGSLDEPSSGEILICNKPISSSPSLLRNQHIGFIFQAYHLLDDYTVLDNVLMPASIAHLSTGPGTAARRRALELLAAVGLSERAHFLAKLLSGGEKQRCAIARALCNDPDLLLADEPSGNLDHAHSTAIHALLLDTAKKCNKGLIVATHDRELSSLCDQVFILKDGLLSLLHTNI